MDTVKAEIEPSLEGVVNLLQGYKESGPQSMESLTKSYLAEAPTAETAQDAAEGLMAQAFQVFDDAADSTLQAFAARQGFELSTSKNYRRRMEEGYFRVAYPIIVMYMAWLDREGQKNALNNLGKFFQATMLGVAGYMILDTILDEQKQNSTEILLALSFIQEHDRLLLGCFDFQMADYDLPFALLLQKSGKSDQIDGYLQFFYEWGAPLQIMDDLMDLEDDLKNGHYSYPLLGFEKELSTRSPEELAMLIKSDKEHIKRLQRVCMQLIESSREKCIQLKADLMGYFVDILEARLNAFFSGMLN
jgi:hypothetical protein